jgi:hypothetical protein
MPNLPLNDEERNPGNLKTDKHLEAAVIEKLATALITGAEGPVRPIEEGKWTAATRGGGGGGGGSGCQTRRRELVKLCEHKLALVRRGGPHCAER